MLDDVLSYSVEPGDSGVALGCVLRFAPAQQLTRDDVLVTRDDVLVSRVEQLDSSLTLGVSEELLSNIINITTSLSDVAQVQFTITLMAETVFASLRPMTVFTISLLV